MGRCPREPRGATFLFPLQVRIWKEAILSKKQKKLTSPPGDPRPAAPAVCATCGTEEPKASRCHVREAAAAAHGRKTTQDF